MGFVPQPILQFDQYFAPPHFRHIPCIASHAVKTNRRIGKARIQAFERSKQHRQKSQRMRPAVIEAGRKLRLIPQQQGAAAHRIAEVAAGLAHHSNRTGGHSGAAIVAGVAFDQDRAAAHVVAGAFADVASNQDQAAFHAHLVAGQGAAEKVAGVAVDFERAFFHFAGGIEAGIAGDQDAAGLHAQAEISAGVAFDADAASAEFLADEVELAEAVLDHDVVGIIAGNIEQRIDAQFRLPGLQFERGDLAIFLAFEVMADQGRQVDALVGAVFQRKGERAHAMISCK